ncbi:MAG: isoprenylcysteine carboxylmethyltransferase family protein [Candidatus Promineofilum sp.]|nr:isoprenylcysteine carboxylmethyltransferase family protein [Promineifilum sp.]
MQGYLAALTLILLIGLVVFRVVGLNRSGIRAMNFGRMDKSDFLIPPFALFYFYTIFAAAFDLPLISTQRFWRSDAVAWLGVFLCAVGLLCLLWSLISFGRSFRVGIDNERPDKLVTTGVFAHSRNPIYVGFIAVLLGQLLVFPNWIPLIYLVAGAWLINRQVVREEAFLRQQYGAEYEAYCRRVRRYV